MKISKDKIKPLSVGISIIILFCLLALRQTDFKLTDYKEFEVVLQKNPTFYEYNIRGANYRELHLYSIDNNCKFIISGFRYKSLKINKDDFIENLNPFDTVNLLISKDDYYTLKKYKKIRDEFEVYNVRHKNFKYIDIKKNNQLTQNDNRILFFFCIIGVIIILYTLVSDIYVAHIITGFIFFIIIAIEFIYLGSK